MKNVKSSQASISVNSCIEFNKTQFFPVSIVKDKDTGIIHRRFKAFYGKCRLFCKQFGMSMS